MAQGVIYYDAALRIVSVNPAAEQILGRPEDNLIGHTITLGQSPIIREDGTPLPAEGHPMHIALRTRQVVRGVILGLIAPEQQAVRWLRIDVVPTFEAGQEAPTQFYALFEDISVQRQTEQTLRAEQQQLATILETMEEALLAIRPDGTIVLINRMARQLGSIGAERHVGSQSEFHAQSGLIAIGPDGQELPREQGPISRAMRGESFSGIELCMHEPVGSAVRWLSCSGAPVYAPDGSLSLGVLTIQDISSRKQDAIALQAHTDALSQANAELTRALRLKDEFLAMMSHELRTPLHVILGFSEALDEQIYGPLTSEQHNALANVSQSGRHLLAILSDILDLAHFEAGKEQFDFAPVEVEHLCRTALQFVQVKAQAKSIRLLRTLEDGIRGLRADERRLTQILVNLLDNAVKFTPANGRVGLEVTAAPEQEQIQFVVWDTGIGIAEADYGRLFQPFSQLDARLSREYGGIGLGLILVRRLVDLHGGSISLSSKPGEGSRFTVTLPWSVQDNTVPQEATRPGAPPPPTWSWAPRILLAEDHELTLRLYSELLRQQGCTVATAYNGEEALARAEEKCPDLVIMDIQMPVMDGLTAIRRMRANPGLAQIPIIAVTALAMPGDRERCMEAGADRYLAKPVGLHQLIEVMSELFNARGKHSPRLP
jgi:signal transduction histidine kinase/ActR/RegA family two-component response regulator